MADEIRVVKTRFEDVSEEGAEGWYYYRYVGYNYEIMIGDQRFLVRTYDDEPGVASVVGPVPDRRSPQVRRLVDWLMSEMGMTEIQLSGGESGGYCAIDPKTLDFRLRDEGSSLLERILRFFRT